MYVCTIQVDPLLQENTILVPNFIIKQEQLIPHEYTLKLGLEEKVAFIDKVQDSNNTRTVFVSQEIASSLRLPKNNIKLQLSITNNRSTICFGPVFMIWTDYKAHHFESSFFQFCKEVALAGEKKGVFTYLQVKGQEEGFILQEGWWKKHSLLPQPDVIYNRIHSRKLEGHPTFQKNKESWESVSFFNDHFINKWQSHEWLYANEKVRDHLPETYLLTSENILPFLSTHPTVYTKPINGSQGRGIFVVEKVLDQGYWIYPAAKEKEEAIWCPSENLLLSFVEKISANQPYIVQQALSLCQAEDGLVDFRFLVHYYNHKWNVTSSVARIGEPNRIISNQAQGGQIATPLDVLKDWFPTDYKKMYTDMIRISKEIATTIMEESDGQFAELGLDLAIDTTGHIWLLEVNSKPSKTAPIREDILIRPSAKALCKVCLDFYKRKNS